MFPTGHLSGQDEPCQLSPKRGGLQKKNPIVEQSFHRNLQTCLQRSEDTSPHDLSLVDIRVALCPSQEGNSSSECPQDGVGFVKGTVLELNHRIRYEKEEEGEIEAEQGSSNIVEHILKELKGINKIQEEISDLREYLTSVRGSVDEVSCCVDAVLSEIGEICSGASAASHPGPVSQTSHIRRGSLGRQNAITSIHTGCVPSHRLPKQWHVYRVNLQSDQLTNQEDMEQDMGPTKADSCYLELHHYYSSQSTSSLSSCLSPEAVFPSGDTDRWSSVGMRNSVSGERGWSEEEVCSCAHSTEELETCPGVWDGCASETESSTPGHSSHNSLEHLSLLFGHHYNSPSSSSSVADWRPQRLPAVEDNLECCCSANCPYSRSSGYNTTDACPNDLNSEPSRSLSCSTVLLTGCADGYLEPPCDDCPSSGDTLDLGSADSLDREWTDHSISRDEACDSLSQESSEMDPDCAKTSNVGLNVTTISKAVLTFRSALKGALKKLEGSNPGDVKEDGGSEALSSPVREAIVQEQQDPEGEVSLMENPTPKGGSEASVYMETPENLPSSPQAFHPEELNSPCTPTESPSVELSQGKGECPTEVEVPNLSPTLDRCTGRQAGSSKDPGLITDEARLSPIRENQILHKATQGRPSDFRHRERIANFHRILRDKRQTHHRLSRSAQGSQNSHGSQGSQGSQSQDEFITGIHKSIFIYYWQSL